MSQTDGSSRITVRMGERGRLVIPAELRRSLGIAPGDTLVAHVDGGRLVLEGRRAAGHRLLGSWGPMPDGRSAVDELLEERRAEAEFEQG